jgi:hypothetical protein
MKKNYLRSVLLLIVGLSSFVKSSAQCKDGATLEKLISNSINCYNTKRPHLSLMMQTPRFIHEKTSQENLTG